MLLGSCAIKHILILNPLIFTIFQSSKRDTEAVLLMLKVDDRIICKRFLNALTYAWTDEHIMNLEILEIQWDIPDLSDIFRIKDSQTVSSSEHKASIRKLA